MPDFFNIFALCYVENLHSRYVLFLIFFLPWLYHLQLFFLVLGCLNFIFHF